MEAKGTKTYHCPYCEKNFTLSQTWQNHVQLHRGEKPFKCPNCSYAARRERELKNHLEARKDKIGHCPHCDFKSCTRQALLNHRKEAHDPESEGAPRKVPTSPAPHKEQEINWKVRTEQNPPTILPSQVTPDLIKEVIQSNDATFPEIKNLRFCSRCDFCSIDSSKFMEHIRGRGEGSPLQCILCTFKTCSISGLIQHRERVHLSVEVNPSIPLKETPVKKTLQESLLPSKKRNRECIHKCDYCDKAFSQMNRLHQHIRFHTGERRFKCNYCSYRAFYKSHLNRHLKTRQGWTLKCSRCALKFCNKVLVQNHLKICHPVAQLRRRGILAGQSGSRVSEHGARISEEANSEDGSSTVEERCF